MLKCSARACKQGRGWTSRRCAGRPVYYSAAYFYWLHQFARCVLLSWSWKDVPILHRVTIQSRTVNSLIANILGQNDHSLKPLVKLRGQSLVILETEVCINSVYENGNASPSSRTCSALSTTIANYNDLHIYTLYMCKLRIANTCVLLVLSVQIVHIVTCPWHLGTRGR